MARVFISHSSKDKAFALELKKWLDGSGHVAWLDESELLVGDQFRAKIDEGMGRCDAVVFALSPDFVHSVWCNYELRVAQHSDKSGNKKLLLPALLKDCEKLPPEFESIRCADFRGNWDKGWKELEQGLARWERARHPSSTQEPSSKAEPIRNPPSSLSPPSSPQRKRQESNSVTRVAAAVMLIFGGLGLLITAQDDSRPPAPQSSRRKSILYEISETLRSKDPPANNTPTGAASHTRITRAVGNDTNSLSELRSQSRVRPLQDNEATFLVERLPSGVFGFVEMDALSLLHKAQVRLTQSPKAFELHKTSAGELLIIGYVWELDFNRAADGGPVSIAVAPKQNQRRNKLISIPLDRIRAVTLKSDQGERLVELALQAAVPDR